MTTKKILGIAIGAGLLYMFFKPNKNNENSNNNIAVPSNEIPVKSPNVNIVHFHQFPNRDNYIEGWHRLCRIDSLTASGAFFISLCGNYNYGQVPAINAQVEWLYTNPATVSVQSQSPFADNLRIVKDVNTQSAYLDCYFAADGLINLSIIGYCDIEYYDNAPLVE